MKLVHNNFIYPDFMQYKSCLTRGNFLTIISYIGLLIAHTAILLKTSFRDWPEPLLYPWFSHMGLTLYKDLVIVMGPLGIFFLKNVYDIFGYSPFVLRNIGIGVLLVIDTLLFIISHRLFKETLISVITILFFITWNTILEGNTLYFEYLLAPLIIGAYWALSSKGSYFNILKVGITGFLIGCAMLIKQTAVYFLIGAVIFVLIKRTKNTLVSIVLLLLIPILLYSGTLIYYSWIGSGKEFFFWTLGIEIRCFVNQCDYAFWPIKRDILYIVPAIIGYVLYFFILIKARRIHKEDSLLFIFICCGFAMAIPRWGFFRLPLYSAFCALSFGFFCYELFTTKLVRLREYIVIFIGIVLIIVGTIRATYIFFTTNENHTANYFGASTNQLASRVKAIVGSQEFYIYGGNDYLYYETDRRPPILPWVTYSSTTMHQPGVEEGIIGKLEQLRVPFVVYHSMDPEGRLFTDGFTIYLNQYLSKNYDVSQKMADSVYMLTRKILP